MKKSDKKQQEVVLTEEQRQALLAAAKEKRTAFRNSLKEAAKKDETEYIQRESILKKTVNQFNESTIRKRELEKKQKEEEEWIQYLSVNTGPDPRHAPELSCALYRWKKERLEFCDFSLAQKRAEEVHHILKTLDEIINYPDDLEPRQLKIFKELSEEIYSELMSSLEAGTLVWVRQSCEELEEVRHTHSTSWYHLALWMLIPLPSQIPRAQDPPTLPIELDFPELSINITLPGNNKWHGVVLRALWFSDDRLSILCPSYADPVPMKTSYGSNLHAFVCKEYENLCNIRNEQAQARKDFYAEIKTRTDALQATINEDKFGSLKAERIELDKLSVLDPAPMRNPWDIVIEDEAAKVTEYLKSIAYVTEEHEVNLRTHRLCGGVLHLHLLEQPSRPKKMRGGITINILEIREKLNEKKFCKVYQPPPPPAPGAVRTPEEIEADIKRQEAALERLFLVHIQLPDTVLWLEPPLVCCWDVDQSKWITNDVHDLKYNEDKFTVNFRIGQLRPIAFATCKYSNLPYQGWELKPNENHTGVIVTIMGAIIVCEMEVLESGIKVKSIQNGATKALQDMVNQTFTLRKLIGRFQTGGVDFFPAEDAPNLINGSCLKLWPLEKHLYHCIAHLCTAYNFTWSRWNVSAGRRAIVQQFREFLQENTEPFLILHITPLNALIVTATEVSPEYSTEPMEGMKFYPDLYNLIEDYGSEEVRSLVKNIPWQLVENLKSLLCAIKPCSYS